MYSMILSMQIVSLTQDHNLKIYLVRICFLRQTLCHSGVLPPQQVHITTFPRTTRASWAPVLSRIAALWWRCTCTAPPSARWTTARTPRSSRHSTNLSRLTLSQNYQISLSKLSIGRLDSWHTLETKFNKTMMWLSLRCFLSEIGPVHRAAVGDGGTAAVIVRDGLNVGLLYIE